MNYTSTPGTKGLKTQKFISLLTVLLLCSLLSFGQQYFGGSGTWNGSVWSNTNSGPYTTAWASGNAIFNIATSTITGATTTVTGITANENVTVTATGTLATGGTVATITVANGKTLDFSGQLFSMAAGTGFIKTGPGTMISSNGNLYPGGFTINDGTMVVGGINSMGGGGALNINGGTVAANATRTIPAAKYSGINIGGNFTFGTTTYASNISFADNVSLGASTTRTISIGSTGIYTFSGIVSGSSSNLVVAGSAAGTLALSGANTYSGSTTVSNGTLELKRTGGATLPSTNNLTVASGGTVLISTAQTLNNVTVDPGGTLIVAATLTVTGAANINGTFQINQGGWATGGTWTYGAAGVLAFNNTSGSYGVNNDVWWSTSNGPANVTVAGAGGITMNVARTVSGLFQTAAVVTNANNLTLNGTGKINTGGSFAAVPVWGSASTLIYNTGTSYGRNNEFPNSGNLPSNVQVSGNTTLNYPNAGLAARTLTGDLTIDAGSAFYMDFGSPNPGVGILTIKNLVMNGNLSLGSQTGGDLVVNGNFSRTGTLNTNSRAVFFSAASGDQTITGSTTFSYLIVDKAAGAVVLANDITVSQVLTLTNGMVSTGANKVIISNNAAASLVRTNGFVNGNLQRAIATGTNTYLFATGTAAGYSGVNLALTSVSATGNVAIKSVDGVSANYPAALNATKRLARNWVVSNSGIGTFTASATFNYLSSDLSGGASETLLKGYMFTTPSTTIYPSISVGGPGVYNFTLSGLTGLTEFGAGECKGTMAPTFTKTYASSCGGGADGTITVTPAGGTAPYTYSWTSSPAGFTSTAAAITNLDVRDYTVVVTEVTGCTSTIPNITILQVQPPTLTNNGGNSGSCNNTGYIILYGGNGVAPYTYSIDGTNYQSGGTFNNVAAGTYTGYVKDLRGCIGTKPGIVISAAATLSVTALAKSTSSCGNTGSIELYRAGGIGPYTFSLDGTTYQNSFVFSNLAAGTYTGYLKDGKGCIATVTGVVVSSTAAVSVTAGQSSSSTCVNDGTIQLRASGGTPGYTYSMDNSTYQSSATFTALAAGSYTGWAKDVKGCTASVSITVLSNPIVVSSYATGSSGCASNGSIQLFRTGGTGPYTYSLDDVTYVSTNTFTGLAGGTYTGWVKDSKGCKASQTGIVVTQPAALTVTAGHSDAGSCVNNGTIQLRPAGGVAGYTYSLDNTTYQSSASFTGLAAGSYTGWVKDSKGCTASVSVSVGTNAITVSSYASPASNCAASDGTIQLFRTGGTNPATFSIDGTNYQSSNVFNALPPGTYSGYVKDANSCVAVQMGIVVGPSCAKFSYTTGKSGIQAGNTEISNLKISAYPNPTSSSFNLHLQTMSNAPVSMLVSDISGRKVIQQQLNGKLLYQFGQQLKPGIYFIQVTQANQTETIKLIKQ